MRMLVHRMQTPPGCTGSDLRKVHPTRSGVKTHGSGSNFRQSERTRGAINASIIIMNLKCRWAALTYTTLPSVYPPLTAANNTKGPVRWTWYLGYDGTLHNVWKDEANDGKCDTHPFGVGFYPYFRLWVVTHQILVNYQLSWEVELKSKRLYAVTHRTAYVNHFYANSGGDAEAPVVSDSLEVIL